MSIHLQSTYSIKPPFDLFQQPVDLRSVTANHQPYVECIATLAPS